MDLATKKGMLIIYIVQSALLKFSQELTEASHSHKNNVCKLAAARIIVMMIHPGIKFPSDVVFRRSMTSGRFITMGFLCPGYGLIITDTHSASKSSIQRFVITEKVPTRAFSWLKVATTAFTFKTLLRR